jgi:hypothetical protein
MALYLHYFQETQKVGHPLLPVIRKEIRKVIDEQVVMLCYVT